MTQATTTRGTIGRRSLIRGIGATTLAASFAPLWTPRVLAQTIDTGSAQLTVLSDGRLSLSLAFSFPEAPQDELKKILADNGLSMDSPGPDCNITLVRSGERLAIFDAGAGSNFMPTAGKLPESLEAAGIDPADVTDVVITHAHPDHIWGLTDDFDELVFANAQVHIGQEEWDFWSAEDAISKVPEDRQTFVVGAQNRFAALGDNIRFLKAGDEVLPGIEAMATPGHTPGHMSFMVHGTEPVVILGDAMTNSAISLARPDWRAGTDQDPEQAAKTRVTLLDRLATEKVRVIGYHFPHPGAGLVERKDDAYRYVPA